MIKLGWPKGKKHLVKREFSEQAKLNMSKAQKQYWSSLTDSDIKNRTKKWRENFNKLSKEEKKVRLNNWIKAGQKSAQSIMSSSIELKVKKQLEKYKIKFVQQKKLLKGKFFVDFYLPEYQLVIECNGNYWHNLPKRKERDKELEEYVLSKGKDILWLWQDEINDEWFDISDYLEV